jgi:hypothetical protein
VLLFSQQCVGLSNSSFDKDSLHFIVTLGNLELCGCRIKICKEVIISVIACRGIFYYTEIGLVLCRIENLELMLKYGVEVWKLKNKQMESVLSR